MTTMRPGEIHPAAGDDGVERRTTPCECLPASATVADWPACATCGLPQAPGKEFCGFCGRRWVSEEPRPSDGHPGQPRA